MKSKAVLNSTLLASALAAMATTAVAGEGGYNGPDLNPISIPVQLDRGISFAAITDVMAVCMVKGDAAEGLQSVAQKLATQMGAQALVDSTGLTLSPNFQTDHLVGITQFAVAFRYPGNGSDYQEDDHISINQVVTPPSAPLSLGSQFDLFVNSGPHIGLTLNTPYNKDVVFPLITYDKVLNDGTFDDFGNLIQGSKLVSGLKIQASVPAGVLLSQIPLINSQTQAPSKFTVNGAEYVQCLQAELQKRSKSSASR